eukprot:364236-Chlamydomonas_euryale.AAC.1
MAAPLLTSRMKVRTAPFTFTPHARLASPNNTLLVTPWLTTHAWRHPRLGLRANPGNPIQAPGYARPAPSQTIRQQEAVAVVLFTPGHLHTWPSSHLATPGQQEAVAVVLFTPGHLPLPKQNRPKVLFLVRCCCCCCCRSERTRALPPPA